MLTDFKDLHAYTYMDFHNPTLQLSGGENMFKGAYMLFKL